MKDYGLKRKWKIHLIHHTHLDIGYTHTQDAVLKLQFKHLEKAMDLIDENINRPFESRFRWNPEATWAIEEWFEQASEINKKRFISMVKGGYIGLDAMYGSLLTGLCRPEELMENFDNKHSFEKITDVKIDSAMITDVPGWNWGLVTALAENGVKYLSSGPNHMDRIGHILKDFGDKPFYWLSPSGKEKVLLFVHGKGYAWFHTGLNRTKNLRNKLTPGRMARYLKKLENSNYPYNTIIIRYNIGSDNGPPDVNLSKIVEEWNSSITQMKLNLSTTSKAMGDFENDYADVLPQFQGDITPYWEDGAYSSSRESAINREAGERLTQANTLSAMNQKAESNKILFHKAWNNVILYSEHTWGAHNSISRPNHPFALSQWAWKKQRALDASSMSKELITSSSSGTFVSPRYYNDILENKASDLVHDEVTVYNTQSWSVSGIVKFNSTKGNIVDDLGKPVLSQRLNDGTMAFMTKDIPSTGSRKYFISQFENGLSESDCSTDGFNIWNDKVKLSVDKKTGTIKSILFGNKELIKQSELEKFNDYVFVKTRFIRFRKKNKENRDIKLSIVEKGPLISTIRIRQSGYKTNSIITDITLIAGSEKIYINNLLDRPAARRKEGLHFEFPFNLPNGRVKYDTTWGSAVVDKDQLKGANRNFITATRWFDISDSETGVSCALLDAPMFKSGSLINDPRRFGNPVRSGWIEETKYNGTIYSYVMNNYWQTNYKADQEGKTLFRYVFRPHGKYSEEETYRFAMEEAQPLIVTSKGINTRSSLITLSDNRIITTSIKPEGDNLVIRLFNISEEEVETNITSKIDGILAVLSPLKDNNLKNGKVSLSPKETILIILKK
ncbi:MAG: hypothetical protein OCD02_07415 [Spirochaetaceae bacterium]